MPTVTITLPHHRYDIDIAAGAIGRLGAGLRALAPRSRAAVIADARVAGTYGGAAAESLRAAGFDVAARSVPSGETTKSLASTQELYSWLIQQRFERGDPLVAVGGGVTGDLVGFVAATYLRGVPFVQCPTTLLAMVDSSIGGKVGVNVPEGKNLVGAFHQPVLVSIDVTVLGTLPDRELRCGLAECIKHGVLADAALFDWIESNLAAIQRHDPDALTHLVEWNVRIKAEVVIADERERGRRALLNLGHTFGHAIEATVGYGRYQHGEAVALGMVAASHLAAEAGRCPPDVPRRIEALLSAAGLPVRSDVLPANDVLLASMRLDKKVAAGAIRLVLPDRIGAATLVSDTPDDRVAAAWDAVRA